jgi:NADPH:quinone reductase-like Zn-dependent oxidoreductase
MSANIAAVLEKPKTPLKIIARAIPKPGADEIVVRNHAIAANPVDWKIQDYDFFVKTYPTVLGSDGAGVVTEVGSSVTKFKVGDRVTGFGAVIYNDKIDHGSWQTYTVLREIATTKLLDSISFEEGTLLPMAFATTAVALFAILGIPRPTGEVKQQNAGFLVWGGASSIGTAAVQLAKNAGFKVFATASPSHHEYLKSLGASDVFDYHDAEVVSKIVAAAKSAGTPISLGFDAITQGETPSLTAQTLLSSSGVAKIAAGGDWPKSTPKPEGVEYTRTGAFRTGTDQSELGAWLFNEYIPEALKTKAIVPAPKVEIVAGGIAATQKVFDQLKAGVSGKKLVVQVE